MGRRLLSYLPADAKNVLSAVTRESYAKAVRVVEYRNIAERRRLARAHADAARFVVPREDGFAMVEPGKIDGADAVVRAGQELTRDFELAGGDWSRKSHMTNLLKPDTLTLDSPFLRFALREDVLAPVAQYLGMVPILRYMGVWCSRYIEGAPYSSQLYHLDGEAPAQLKIFIFCSDVTMDNGPLTVLPAATTERVTRTLRYGVWGGRVDDAAVRQLTTERDHRPLMGPTGTACFVDTDRCFHFGSRVEKSGTPRLVAVFQYLTPLSFRLWFGRHLPFKHLATPSMPRLQRLALGAQ